MTRAQVYACLAYYEDYRPEIDLLIPERIVSEHGLSTNVNFA